MGVASAEVPNGYVTATLPLGPDGGLDYRFEIYRVSGVGEQLIRSGDDQHTTLLVVQSGTG